MQSTTEAVPRGKWPKGFWPLRGEDGRTFAERREQEKKNV